MVFIEESQKIFQLFRIAMQQDASDLHIKVGSPPNIRVNGLLQDVEFPPITPHDAHYHLLPLLTPKMQKNLSLNKDINTVFQFKSFGRIRASIFKQRGSISAVFRFIKENPPTMKELGLPEAIREMALRPRGLLLVTGSANNGKSTTLAAIVNEINANKNSHIITVEDPVEYVHKKKSSLITQRELESCALTYERALTNALREDPDVILIGEMRNLETIEMALTSAETGHLVLSTLHTIGAPQSIDRIINAFPAYRQEEVRTQASLNLIGVISQILFPKLNGGRVPAFEIMVVTSAMRNLIREKKTNQLFSNILLGRKYGCITMKESIQNLMKKRQIEQKLGKKWLDTLKE
ncbi:type IV pilus twitching motility protein PilT [Candidatus Riflebacteria bacterium]